MKTLKTTLIIVLALVAAPCISQENNKSQAFWVHEDVVKPSMVSEYETVCKELTDNMKKHNVQEMNSIVANLSDNRYLWVGPIENMAHWINRFLPPWPKKWVPKKWGLFLTVWTSVMTLNRTT